MYIYIVLFCWTKISERSTREEGTENRGPLANGRVCFENNFFEFNNQIKQQISGMAIDTKCAPTYACIFMDKAETEYLETQTDKPFWWLRYIDDFFFIWTPRKTKSIFRRSQ